MQIPEQPKGPSGVKSPVQPRLPPPAFPPLDPQTKVLLEQPFKPRFPFGLGTAFKVGTRQILRMLGAETAPLLLLVTPPEFGEDQLEKDEVPADDPFKGWVWPRDAELLAPNKVRVKLPPHIPERLAPAEIPDEVLVGNLGPIAEPAPVETLHPVAPKVAETKSPLDLVEAAKPGTALKVDVKADPYDLTLTLTKREMPLRYYHTRTKDEKPAKFYRNLLAVINKTWGNVDEALDAAEVFMWSIKDPRKKFPKGHKRAGEPMPALLIENGDVRAVLSKLGTRYKVDTIELAKGLAMNHLEDLAIGKMNQATMDGLKRAGYNRLIGVNFGTGARQQKAFKY